MRPSHANAPILAWLLAGLTCLLVAMAFVEARHQAVALPVSTRVEAAGTAHFDPSPTGTPVPTPGSTCAWGGSPTPWPTPLVGDIPVTLSRGPVFLRVSRLVVPPDVRLPPEAAWDPTVLVVESGTLSVRINGARFIGQNLEPPRTETALNPGEWLVVPPESHYAIRNDGATLVEASMVTIVACETPA